MSVMLFILSILTYDFAKIINLLFDWWFCHMNRWPIRVVAFKWNICLQIELLCLYPRSSVNQKNNIIWVLHLNKWLSILDRVSGWGKSFVPPPLPRSPSPPIERIVDHMWTQSYVLSFCLVTSVWKDIKTFSPPSSLCLVLVFFYLAF